MKQKITLKHIARELGVSISTVSKALKNSQEISTDTKEKVQAFAKLYNYKPNNVAISLKNKRTKNIGVIIPDIVHHFFTTVIRGVEQYANKLGYNVVVCVSNESFDKEVINMEMLANGSVDGFIMSISTETQKLNDFNHLREVTDQGIPLVLFDRTTNEIECDKVIIDDRVGARKAVEKFIENGKRKIALVTTENYLNIGDARETGYRDAMSNASLSVDENLILKLPSMEIDEKAIQQFFDTRDIDAVLCVNEIFAIHCMNLVQQKGVKVPEEMSFIGFTDGMLSKYANPGLTSVAQYGEQMGETAAKMLIHRVEHEDELEEDSYTTEVIASTLIERGSTL